MNLPTINFPAKVVSHLLAFNENPVLHPVQTVALEQAVQSVGQA